MAGFPPRPARSPARQLLRDLAFLLVGVVVLYAAIGTTLAAVRVVGHSMDPTLTDGDLLLSTRLDYRFHAPERGDIVIFTDPLNSGQEFVKRVVGLPGDHLLIRAGFVYVNSRRLAEPYVGLPWQVTTNWPTSPSGPDGETVPPDNYFVLGDNRDNSGDSRLFGYITSHQILGKAIARILPPEHSGALDQKPTLGT